MEEKKYPQSFRDCYKLFHPADRRMGHSIIIGNNAEIRPEHTGRVFTLFLHDNPIAYFTPYGKYISTRGYNTETTVKWFKRIGANVEFSRKTATTTYKGLVVPSDTYIRV